MDKLKSFLRNVELVNGYRDYEGGPCTNRINLAPLMQRKAGSISRASKNDCEVHGFSFN